MTIAVHCAWDNKLYRLVMYLFLSAMGGRKFRLSAQRSCRKKQQQRAINGLIISPPKKHLPPLLVSFPITSYLGREVDATALHARLKFFGLPPTWIILDAPKIPVTLMQIEYLNQRIIKN